jgi:hypothetical protein
MLIFRQHGKQIEFLGSTVVEWFAYGLAVFLILFPKGGFKAGSVPLTWGYGLIGLALIFGVPFWLLRISSRVPRGILGLCLSLAPIQFLFIYSLLVNGIDDFGFALSDLVAFFLLPFAFVLIFSHFLPKIRMERLIVLACWLVFLAAAYGIFLFVWRLTTGTYIEIPFLTVNLDDVGTLDSKFNARPGGLFKLISTYNNGNQYGVATLLLLPLFDAFEPSRFRKLLVRVALALTLSRTIWIGLILNQAFDVGRHLFEDLKSSKRFSIRLSIRYSTFFGFGRLALLGVFVLGMTLLFSGVSFLFDSSLGGRTSYFDDAGPITVFPSAPVAQFVEIIYFSALTMLGWAGLAAIVLLFFSPIVLAIRFKELRRTTLQVAALQGLILYIPLAGMDGALNYIPTMAFYWFLWMLFIYGGPFNMPRVKKAIKRSATRSHLSLPTHTI